MRAQILSQKPTPEQNDAIFAKELEFLLRASPGSGKTWTSCRRFIWRGANWKYPVGGLALLSFTNTAIHEFHQATIKVGQRELLSDPNYVGTFDSFVERFIITPFGHLVAGMAKKPRLFTAPRPGDWANKKLKGWIELGVAGRKQPVPAWEIIPFPTDKSVSYKASNSLGGKILDFKWGNPVFEFFKLGYYTHSQRVFLACCLLSQHPHISKCLARRFPEIIVDEAQDTNAWLLILLEALREKGTKITLIGDPDQCIYEFSMADATSLQALQKNWKIKERPLNKSFRCNDAIALAARNISGNLSFIGSGPCQSEHHGAYIVRDSGKHFGTSIFEFEQLLNRCLTPQCNSAILCRGRSQIEAICGKNNYNLFKGLTKKMAQASFYRDVLKNYRKAYEIVVSSLCEMIDEEGFSKLLDRNVDTDASMRTQLAIWMFVKSSDRLPSIRENAEDWIDKLKVNLTELLQSLGIYNMPVIGRKIRRTGLGKGQLQLALFTPQTVFPSIRQATIHQVKGKSIDAVLVLGSAKFFNTVVSSVAGNKSSEERRLAYVAMTRARHALLVGLPGSHYDKHADKWINWGFKSL